MQKIFQSVVSTVVARVLPLILEMDLDTIESSLSKVASTNCARMSKKDTATAIDIFNVS